MKERLHPDPAFVNLHELGFHRADKIWDLEYVPTQCLHGKCKYMRLFKQLCQCKLKKRSVLCAKSELMQYLFDAGEAAQRWQHTTTNFHSIVIGPKLPSSHRQNKAFKQVTRQSLKTTDTKWEKLNHRAYATASAQVQHLTTRWACLINHCADQQSLFSEVRFKVRAQKQFKFEVH